MKHASRFQNKGKSLPDVTSLLIWCRFVQRWKRGLKWNACLHSPGSSSSREQWNCGLLLMQVYRTWLAGTKNFLERPSQRTLLDVFPKELSCFVAMERNGCLDIHWLLWRNHKLKYHPNKMFSCMLFTQISVLSWRRERPRNSRGLWRRVNVT